MRLLGDAYSEASSPPPPLAIDAMESRLAAAAASLAAVEGLMTMPTPPGPAPACLVGLVVAWR